MDSETQFGLKNRETTELVKAVGLNPPQSFEEVIGKYAFAPSRVYNADNTSVF